MTRFLLTIINHVDRIIGHHLTIIVVLLSLFVAGGMVTGIIARSLLQSPLLGLEELILFAVIWLYMLGAALASRESSHLSADFLSDYLPDGRFKTSIQFTAKAIAMIAVLAFAVWSFDLFAWGFEMKQATPVFRLPFYLVQSSMFIASILMVIYTLRDLLIFTEGRR